MRLINTQTIQPQKFISDVPPYAILSHRWRSGPLGEATLQELELLSVHRSRTASSESVAFKSIHPHGEPVPSPESRQDPLHTQSFSADRYSGPPKARGCSPGIEKVVDFCRVARDFDYQWAWIDTVCIDKTDKDELSEAINSMFTWYMYSGSCFVYLWDVVGDISPAMLRQCDWFKRGWTLQELLAPDEVTFFGSDWKQLGTKKTLENELSTITRIPAAVLAEPALIWSHSIAQRMSWVGDRTTTREEDIAYCLLGLFGINMALLYGEGAQEAFERMQIHILERYDDQSLLAWEMIDGDQPYATAKIYDANVEAKGHLATGVLTGVLARSPRQFLRSGGIVVSDTWASENPLRMTSRGLEITSEVSVINEVTVRELRIGGKADGVNDSTILAVQLACNRVASTRPCLVILIKDTISLPSNRWCRIMLSESENQHFGELVEHRQSKRDGMRVFVSVSWPERRTGYRPRGSFFRGGGGGGGGLTTPRHFQPRDPGGSR